MADPGQLRAAEEVARGVYVLTAAAYTTTTTVVSGTGGGCLLIDPAVSVADLAGLAGWLSARGLHPVAGWSTHPHWDHLLWAEAFGDVPRYATPRAVAVAGAERHSLVADVERSAPGHDLSLFADVRPKDGPEIDWPGPRAVIYQHDAHAPGHGALYLPDSGVLIAGDMCSDIEIPLPDLDSADPFGGYRAGLSLLESVPGTRVIVPGHGHVGDRAEFLRRVAVDHAYLDALDGGTAADDRRLDTGPDWLRPEHARHQERAAALRAG